MLATGGPFPDRVLRDLAGGLRPVGEAWSRGPALLALGHGDCETTRLALTVVERLHARRRPTAGVLAVLQEDVAGARALADELELSLPILLDEDPYPLCQELGLESVPTLVLLGGDGRVRRVVEGFRRDELEALAEALGVRGALFGADEATPSFRPG